MFNTNLPWYLRFHAPIRMVDSGGETGGGSADASDSSEGNAGEQSTDWEAKYNEAIRHSREWEKRAKDNKNAADELEKLKEANLSEAEKTAKKIKDLEAKNAAYEAERQQAEWKAQVSKETGVPAELLHGDSLDDMKANAKALDQWAHPKPKGMPNQGGTPQHAAAGVDERAWVNNMFSAL